MKPLATLCEPRQSVFDAAKRDTVLDLTDLIGDRIKPSEFFEENYVTEGMSTLLQEVFRRLEGKSEQAVFYLITCSLWDYSRGSPRFEPRC